MQKSFKIALAICVEYAIKLFLIIKYIDLVCIKINNDFARKSFQVI